VDRRTSTHSTVLRSLREDATAHIDAGQLDAAIAVLRSAIAVAQHQAVAVADRVSVLIAYAEALTWHSSLISNSYDHTIAIAREAEGLARGCDPQLHAAALDALGFALYHQAMTGGVGDFDEAARAFEAALSLRQTGNDPHALAESMFHVGLIAERERRFDDALRHYEAGAVLATKLGVVRAAMQIAYSVGELYEMLTNLAQARSCYERGYALATQMQFEQGMALCSAKLNQFSS
jgi:tetratricopeptide (TPR) repeat protein